MKASRTDPDGDSEEDEDGAKRKKGEDLSSVIGGFGIAGSKSVHGPTADVSIGAIDDLSSASEAGEEDGGTESVTKKSRSLLLATHIPLPSHSFADVRGADMETAETFGRVVHAMGGGVFASYDRGGDSSEDEYGRGGVASRPTVVGTLSIAKKLNMVRPTRLGARPRWIQIWSSRLCRFEAAQLVAYDGAPAGRDDGISDEEDLDDRANASGEEDESGSQDKSKISKKPGDGSTGEYEKEIDRSKVPSSAHLRSLVDRSRGVISGRHKMRGLTAGGRHVVRMAASGDTRQITLFAKLCRPMADPGSTDRYYKRLYRNTRVAVREARAVAVACALGDRDPGFDDVLACRRALALLSMPNSGDPAFTGAPESERMAAPPARADLVGSILGVPEDPFCHPALLTAVGVIQALADVDITAPAWMQGLWAHTTHYLLASATATGPSAATDAAMMTCKEEYI